jgi:tetratricopeptide (TPR) repeat protein
MIDLFNAGRQYRQSGDLPRAEAAFRELLSFEPTNAEVWQALGSVCRDQGKHGDALAAFQRAVTLDPDFAQAHNSLGIAFLEQGRYSQAAECLERAISINPEQVAAHNNLGNVYLALGRKTEALARYQEAVRLHPSFAEAHGNLGNVLRELGRLDEALASCLRAVELKPVFAIGHNHLGAVYANQRRWEDAAASFRQAISLEPRYFEAHVNLGDVLRQLGRLPEAEAALRDAVRLRPEMANAHLSLALVLLDRDDLEAAAAGCREALRLDPRLSAAHQALAMIQVLQGRCEEAVGCYERSLEFDRNDAAGHRNLAILELLLGRYERGWAEYEWRWQAPEAAKRTFSQPLWDGSPLAGKTILLHAEQGLGDTIQFVRFASLVRRRGGRVILACQKSLLPLLRRAADVDELVPLGGAVPACDVYAPLMSLPRILGTTVETIPAAVPYLEAEAQLVETWRNELASLPGFKVGITWQGSPSFRFDRYRSIRLLEFAPLAAVPGVTLVSLQKGYGSEQVASLAGRFEVVDLGPRLDESGAFLDTAAVMKNLDLVISADTAIPHLAGALGVPVWLATPLAPDWRWLLSRDDSPWYPTMRLFRQSARGEWGSVFRRMAAALAQQLGAPLPPEPLAIEVAPGELLDKITILEIKSQRITDAAKLKNVRLELDTLLAVRDRSLARSAELDALTAELKQVNEALWEIEDHIRLEERKEDFGSRFVELARSVYRQNDRRAAIKRRINDLTGSRLIEEKSYETYAGEVQ